MTFTWTTIHVRDLDQSLAFYHDLLGLPIQERFGPPGHEIAMLGPEEGTRLELIGGGEIPQHPAPTLSLGFSPENMGQLLAALEGWVERLPGRGREKEGRRQKLGRLLLKLFEWIRRELYADHHRN